MKLVLTQQETIQAIQYYLVNHKNMTVDKLSIQYEGFTETQTESKDQNPWLVPDEDGWFTNNPEWKLEEPPDYVDSTRDVTPWLRKYGVCNTALPIDLDWSVDSSNADIVKWKYAD